MAVNEMDATPQNVNALQENPQDNFRETVVGMWTHSNEPEYSMMESCNHQYLGSFQGEYVLDRTYKRIHKTILEKQSSECEHTATN